MMGLLACNPTVNQGRSEDENTACRKNIRFFKFVFAKIIYYFIEKEDCEDGLLVIEIFIHLFI